MDTEVNTVNPERVAGDADVSSFLNAKNGVAAEPTTTPSEVTTEQRATEETPTQTDNTVEHISQSEQKTESTEQEVAPPTGDAFDFSSLKETLGVEVNNVDDLVNAFQQLKGNTSDELSAEAKGLIEYQKKGGDMSEYFKMQSMDFDSLDAKSVLREKFFKDNPDLVSKNKDHANRKFEKQYKEEAGILEKKFKTPEEREDYVDEYGESAARQLEEDIKYAEEEISIKKDAALNELNQWKESTTTVKQGLSKEEIEKYEVFHKNQVQQVMGDFKGFEVKLTDDQSANVNVPENMKGVLEKAMQTPIEALKEHFGIDLNSQTEPLDHKKFFETMVKVLTFDNVGRVAAKTMQSSSTINAVENMLENPANSTANPSAPSEKSAKEKMIEAARSYGRKARYGS